MIISRLSLHNFGIYAGDNTFTFTHKKPIELIGGMNGRGKTTFLNAILVALYGQNSFAYKESEYKTYAQYLKAHVNTNDGTMHTFVEIEFTMDHEDNSLYVIRRSWEGNQYRTLEKLVVLKDGEYSQFLTDNWDMYIENIIPSALSKFFFFDGEQIAEIVAKNNTRQIKDSIRALLGIDTIDALQKDLKRVNAKVKKSVGAKFDQKEIDRLSQARDAAKAALAKHDQAIELKNVELQEVIKNLEKAESKYKRLGGDSVEKREENEQLRSALIADVNAENTKLTDQAAGELPLELVHDLLNDIQKQVKRENDAKSNKVALERIKELAAEFQTGSKQSKTIESFLSFINDTTNSSSVDIIYDFSDRATYQLEHLNNSQIKNSINTTGIILEKRNKDQKMINELDNYLSLDIDEKAVKKQFEKISSLKTRKKDLEFEINQLEIEQKVLNGNVRTKEIEFNKYIGNALGNIETADDSERIMKYTHLMNEVFNKFKIRLQQEKLDILSKTISECYKQLRSKSNLIDHVGIDYESLEFTYYNRAGSVIDRVSLSAGEKQMIVICVLWGLAICSKRNLPVIIDTPLGRMDSVNRDVLVKKYFPKASEQVIILSTDTEIDRKYYKMMKPNISDEYLIIYDDKTSSSHIENGYFFEDAS